MTEVLATIWDTVVPQSLPIEDAYQGVLAYRDGPYRWFPAQAERFHAAGKLVYPISVEGKDPHLAQVVDCEAGDLTVTQAADWARARNALHHDATVYASLNTICDGTTPTLIDALGDEPCWLWVAWWTGKPQVPPLALPSHIRIAAVQYQGLTGYDASAIVSKDWPGSPYTDMAHW